MNREILFRAKSKNSGRWVFGDLITQKYKSRQGIHIYEKNDNLESGYQFVRIDKRTIGQYIGLTDKNGTKIFEGDIVRDNKQYDNYEIKFGRIGWDSGVGLTGYVTTNKDEMNIGKDNEEIFYECDRLIDLNEIEVIGNIWDTPELLGGADENQSN